MTLTALPVGTLTFLEQLWVIPPGWSLCEDGLVRSRYVSLWQQNEHRERLAAALVAS